MEEGCSVCHGGSTGDEALATPADLVACLKRFRSPTWFDNPDARAGLAARSHRQQSAGMGGMGLPTLDPSLVCLWEVRAQPLTH